MADIRLGLCHRSDKPGLCMEGPALLKVGDSWGGINSELIQRDCAALPKSGWKHTGDHMLQM